LAVIVRIGRLTVGGATEGFILKEYEDRKLNTKEKKEIEGPQKTKRYRELLHVQEGDLASSRAEKLAIEEPRAKPTLERTEA